ncbi:rab geranylgeranyltransferase alpha subunit, pu [Ostreococcus tauri]|uniref:Geranylgeranyl transferase type-2 subunit alpha n=2 Tax=Ostreococcus tauri TaxID=70448 RepID=A0A1Y5I8H8_OSTTA|nr:rab geranylgeranyltransferase alpha subunit, pu [Ostreococcus tauri]
MRATRASPALARPHFRAKPSVRTRERRVVITRAEQIDRVVLACTSKECKRNGALKTLKLLEEACERTPGVRCGTTRCQSECASGPNVKLLPEGAVLNDVKTVEARLLRERGKREVKAWLENYMRRTTPFYGCKMPTTRACVKEAVAAASETRKRRRDDVSAVSYVEDAVALLQHTHGDAKQAGAILLCEHEPVDSLATPETLRRLEDEVLRGSHVNDWAVADSLAIKVFKKMWKNNISLAPLILNWSKDESATLWQRRCGIVAFVSYFDKERDRDGRWTLDDSFWEAIIDACERNLLLSPEERFTQTGSAWVTRYALASDDSAVRDYARDMVLRNGTLWTTEAKKSLVERLLARKNDSPRRSLAREKHTFDTVQVAHEPQRAIKRNHVFIGEQSNVRHVPTEQRSNHLLHQSLPVPPPLILWVHDDVPQRRVEHVIARRPGARDELTPRRLLHLSRLCVHVALRPSYLRARALGPPHRLAQPFHRSHHLIRLARPERRALFVVSRLSRHRLEHTSASTDATTMAMTEKLVTTCPEVTTGWNRRKEAVELGAETAEAARDWWSEELRVSEIALRNAPKSYPSWYHRKWTVSRMIRTMGRESETVRMTLERERALCSRLLDADDRNFHCWAYRRFIVQSLGVTTEEELEYTLKKIEDNFSNYSAWHQRSAILDARGDVDSATLKGEFELASNAFYTEPEDQSAWMYHRWLIARARALKIPDERDAAIASALEICREVAELEPGCKWPLLARASLEDEKSRRDVLDRLSSIDPARVGYYRDVA